MTVEAIGGHRVVRVLGQGGMGCVYLCHDAALERQVAVKVLQPELLDQGEMRARFLREARALARVSSPHVVAVHAVGEDVAAGPYVVMEYLDGEDLQARLSRERRLPWRQALFVCRDAAHGLAAAAAAGIIHRDIKPANLFVVGGRAKLTDFGLAREVTGHAALTQAGLVVGTPSYLAPEVIKGGAATVQSDVYALGATLFHLVVGHPPFVADGPLEVLALALRDEVPSLRRALAEAEPGADVPVALDQLVATMTARTAERRPADYSALVDDIGRVLDGTPLVGRTMTFGATVAPPPEVTGAQAAQPSAPGTPATEVPPEQATQPMSLRAPGAPSEPSSAATSGEIVAAARMKTQALTVMMTDIAGYTERTSRVSREEAARWLAVHDALLQPVFRAFGGRVVKTLGDAFLVTFGSPTDAVHCACAVQDRLVSYNAGVPAGDAILVRIALSAGEVRLHRGDVFGEPVNLAARIEAIAQPGEVLLSDAVYATMNAAEVKLSSRGDHTFKGIARSVVVWQAVPDPTQPMPFGGRALARVKDTPMDALRAGAPVALARAATWARQLRATLAPRWARLRALVRSLGPRGGRPDDAGRSSAGRVGALAAAALVVMVLIAALALALRRDDRQARIDSGPEGARAVVADIERLADKDRTAVDWQLLGHARGALGERAKSVAAYKRAVALGEHGGALQRALLAALEEKNDAGAVDVLAAWPDAGMDDALTALLNDERWWPRHHAQRALDARGKLADEQREQVAFLDVTSDECSDRKVGLSALKKIGVSDEALQAVQRLGADPFRNGCLILDVPAAEAAIKKRQRASKGAP